MIKFYCESCETYYEERDLVKSKDDGYGHTILECPNNALDTLIPVYTETESAFCYSDESNQIFFIDYEVESGHNEIVRKNVIDLEDISKPVQYYLDKSKIEKLELEDIIITKK